jgi:hypothetical protein
MYVPFQLSIFFRILPKTRSHETAGMVLILLRKALNSVCHTGNNLYKDYRSDNRKCQYKNIEDFVSPADNKTKYIKIRGPFNARYNGSNNFAYLAKY